MSARRPATRKGHTVSRTTAPRVTTDDLLAAIQWLGALEDEGGTPMGAHEPQEDDEDQARLRRVALWIAAEVDRREDARTVRTIARDNGVSITRARAALAAVRA